MLYFVQTLLIFLMSKLKLYIRYLTTFKTKKSFYTLRYFVYQRLVGFLLIMTLIKIILNNYLVFSIKLQVLSLLLK